jgi:hypothetical protein
MGEMVATTFSGVRDWFRRFIGKDRQNDQAQAMPKKQGVD